MKDFSIIGLRIFAIWIFLKALLYLQYLPMLFVSNLDEFSQIGGYGFIIAFLLYLCTAIFLYFKTSIIADKIIPSSDSDSLKIELDKLTSVLFATAGILIFFWSINTFLNSVNSIFYFRTIDPENVNKLREIRLVLFGGVIQMIFGLSLFIGGKKIAKWWHDFRNWT